MTANNIDPRRQPAPHASENEDPISNMITNLERQLPQRGASAADAIIDLALEDSIPASDPPSFVIVVGSGAPSTANRADKR
jgi:hypothetical protein